MAPEASKDIAKNSFDVNIASIQIKEYKIVSIFFNGVPRTILARPKESIIPIPIDTTITILNFDIKPVVTKSTCPARMCKSGSAIEIINPSIKPEITIFHILFVFAMIDPIKLPIGVIPISTPSKKIDNPIIIRPAPMRNLEINVMLRGVKVKFSINTITIIGRTAYDTSFNLETNSFKYNTSFLSTIFTLILILGI
ncbi:hypothetical protein CBF_3019 [Clostridium botulinum F str. 230613]|uniref:Uncharacterized protein n=1 Tax=Clostridium botulinum (strain Langeland / NCTC 10281 / Type F) TaxID=441772 RepID=A7GHJ0_CLOBL|nr:hypothetical protein CLI_3026 [Clostridium botulinum F str. Langeland]ADG00625.1 hypothetical protein CBF_3019 [Clostridium botulinum F str. 230613]